MNVYDPIKCKCQAREGHFLLAQFYYDIEEYEKAWKWYSKIKNADLRGRFSCLFMSLISFFLALYQLAVMCFERVAPKEYKPV
jgi:tetratricopeptide (TPR) repeat protein